MAEMIQRLSEKSLPHILHIERACFQPPWSENQLSQSLVNERYRVDGAFQKELQGFAIFTVIAGEAELLQIGVSPDFQRQGVAASLLQYALKDLNTERVLLEVRESNRAARCLYKELGFQLDGIRKAYYPSETEGGCRENAVLMSYSPSE